MQITREKVVERIKQLEAAVRQLEGTLDTHLGALQDARFWLGQLDAEEEKADGGKED
jgi:hypothetical protein